MNAKQFRFFQTLGCILTAAGWLFLAACAARSTESATESANAPAAIAPKVSPTPNALAANESTDPLERLLAGNKRFAAGHSIHPDEDLVRRAALATGQKPFAVVVSCSDSRVPPELVFDQGFGDLFVVRVAGNIFDDAVDGSIEYATEHLGAGLIVVLGHESCGAVKAAMEHNREAHIKTLAKAIEPALIESAKLSGDATENAVRANVQMVRRQIETNQPILSKLVQEKRVRVVGAYYDLHTGAVSLVE